LYRLSEPIWTDRQRQYHPKPVAPRCDEIVEIEFRNHLLLALTRPLPMQHDASSEGLGTESEDTFVPPELLVYDFMPGMVPQQFLRSHLLQLYEGSEQDVLIYEIMQQAPAPRPVDQASDDQEEGSTDAEEDVL
jgi:hypothetical protein